MTRIAYFCVILTQVQIVICKIIFAHEQSKATAPTHETSDGVSGQQPRQEWIRESVWDFSDEGPKSRFWKRIKFGTQIYAVLVAQKPLQEEMKRG